MTRSSLRDPERGGEYRGKGGGGEEEQRPEEEEEEEEEEETDQASITPVCAKGARAAELVLCLVLWVHAFQRALSAVEQEDT